MAYHYVSGYSPSPLWHVSTRTMYASPHCGGLPIVHGRLASTRHSISAFPAGDTRFHAGLAARCKLSLTTLALYTIGNQCQ
jgi:hypothetical protein